MKLPKVGKPKKSQLSAPVKTTGWKMQFCRNKYSCDPDDRRFNVLSQNRNRLFHSGVNPSFAKPACSILTEIVKILVPLTNNPNAPDHYGRTPILEAAYCGFTEIVKILVPITDNPNAPDKHGNAPINTAKKYGYTEIVKILAPLTDNPNALNKDGQTPSSVAKNAEI